jgi:methyl-accepting chemotaxis protein
MNTGIRFKTFLPLAVIVVVIACGLGVTMWIISSQLKDSIVVNIAGRQRMLTQKMSKDALALSLGVEEARDRLEKSSSEFDAAYNALINGGVLDIGEVVELPPVKDADILEQMDRIGAVWKAFYADVKVMLDKDSDLPSFTAAAKRIESGNVAFLQEVSKATNLYALKGTRNMRFLMKAQVALFAITILMAGIGWYMFKRLIVNPVSDVVATAKLISEGDLSAKDIDIRSRDEMQTLAESLNRMKENLSSIMGKLKQTSDEIISVSKSFAGRSRQIVQGAEKQSTSIEQVATAMEEMSATVVEVAKNSQTASETAEAARQTAVKGGEVVRTAVEGMTAVAETVNACADKVTALGQSSNQIGAIVAVINDIADQTNLLALNAAIEAARAGEQGRGFAVVADEVRKLAEKTTKATKEIAGMIKTIQADTKVAIESMQRGNRQAEDGVRLAGDSGEVLSQIVESVQKVSDMIRQNATATEEQSSTVDEITGNLNGIAEIAKKTTASIKDVSDATENLNRVAEELRTLVGTFRLSPDPSHGEAPGLRVISSSAA